MERMTNKEIETVSTTLGVAFTIAVFSLFFMYQWEMEGFFYSAVSIPQGEYYTEHWSVIGKNQTGRRNDVFWLIIQNTEGQVIKAEVTMEVYTATEEGDSLVLETFLKKSLKGVISPSLVDSKISVSDIQRSEDSLK